MNKTIADIIAEKRELAEKIRWGTPSLDEIEAAVNLEFDANRIEAARKREKAEVEALALSVGGMVEASRHKQVGNSAAMREAVETALTIIRGIISGAVARTNNSVFDCRDKLKDALSKPPRNCDVGTAEEQYKRHEAYCEKQDMYCLNDDTLNCRMCFGKWAQMPHEPDTKKEGDAK